MIRYNFFWNWKVRRSTFKSGMELLSQPALPNRGCFVIDYSMPLMNGLELLARLRARRSTLPVILITGRPDRRSTRKQRMRAFSKYCANRK